MGLILDTGVFVLAERRNIDVATMLLGLAHRFGDQPMGLSVITIAELTHGIYRANSADRSQVRKEFVDSIERRLLIHPLTVPLARLVGRIEGEQAAVGNTIAFEDLVIGATAVSLSFSVVTGNPKHFHLIPNLTVLTL